MLRTLICTLSGFLASGALFIGPLHAADWPTFRGPNKNGILNEKLTLLPGGPRKIWEGQTGEGNASLAIAKGRLYTFSQGNHNLICLDVKSGEQIWSKRMDTYFGDSTPAVENDRVFLLPSTREPTAYCFDANTGAVLWKRTLPTSSKQRHYGHAGSPLLWHDFVIFNVGAGAALKKSTGEVEWLHEGFPGLATPVHFKWRNRDCVAIFGGEQLIAREALTGKFMWAIPWDTGELAVNACDPVVFDTKIFLSSDYGRGRALYDFSGEQPKTLWEFGQGKGSPFSSGFFRDGHIFCVADGKFSCLDVVTGTPRWQAPVKGQSLLIGDILICVGEPGDISFARITPERFELIGTHSAGIKGIKAVPAYSEGKLFLRSERGQIVCLQIGQAT